MIIHQNFKVKGYFDYYIEKYKNYPITIYWDYTFDFRELDKTRINIFVTHEPNELFKIHDWVYAHHNLFNAVISWDRELISKIDNGIEFMCSWRLTSDPDWEFLGDKKFEVSFLSGTTKFAEGHILRQKIYKLKNQIKIPKQWYYVLEDYDVKQNVRPGYPQYSKNVSHIPEVFKYEPNIYGKKLLFENTMFHIGVENMRKTNWINDRAWSCFASKVVPIYWGAPNLEEFGYDERGVIRFNDENDIVDIVNNLTPDDYYDRLPYIEHNYQVSKLDNFHDKFTYIIDELIKLNNL
jgi:hypothetical protein